MRRAALTLGLVGLSGCVLDFDQFRTPSRRDAGAELTRDAADAADVTDATDAADESDATDVADAVVDAAPMDLPACTVGRGVEARLRFAHMASGFGLVDLCMRRRVSTGPAETFRGVAAPEWSTDGVDYAQVSTSVPLNRAVAQPNEAWELAVVAHGTECSTVSTRAPALAQRSVQFDPGVLRLIVLTAERASGGGSVGVLSVLPDEDCTDCAASQVDVRAVHASFGSASQRLTFALEPLAGLSQDLMSMRTFASGVGYGADVGYACNALWGAFLSRISTLVQVQFVALTTGGVAIARSELTRIKPSLLARTRVVTVFFESDVDADTGATLNPGFVLCYDGVDSGSLTSCDRIPARLVVPAADAGLDAARDAARDADDARDDVDSDAGAVDDARARDDADTDEAVDAGEADDDATSGAPRP